jgi:signal transduction histidine kinase
MLVSQKDARRKISKELQEEIAQMLTSTSITTGEKHREHHREKLDIYCTADPLASAISVNSH